MWWCLLEYNKIWPQSSFRQSRHCELCCAIQGSVHCSLDCFVPRKDEVLDAGETMTEAKNMHYTEK